MPHGSLETSSNAPGTSGERWLPTPTTLDPAMRFHLKKFEIHPTRDVAAASQCSADWGKRLSRELKRYGTCAESHDDPSRLRLYTLGALVTSECAQVRVA